MNNTIQFYEQWSPAALNRHRGDNTLLPRTRGDKSKFDYWVSERTRYDDTYRNLLNDFKALTEEIKYETDTNVKKKLQTRQKDILEQMQKLSGAKLTLNDLLSRPLYNNTTVDEAYIGGSRRKKRRGTMWRRRRCQQHRVSTKQSKLRRKRLSSKSKRHQRVTKKH